MGTVPELITGSPHPDAKMKAANREAAEECLLKKQAAFRKKSFKEALRLAEKSLQMCKCVGHRRQMVRMLNSE